MVGATEFLVGVAFDYLSVPTGWLESLVGAAVLVAISAPLLYRALQPCERALRESKELARANQLLSGLYGLADALRHARSEEDVLNNTLRQFMKFPGVQAGWVSLREGETGFRLAAACGLPPALEDPGAFQGDCLCRRKLLAGELDQITNWAVCAVSGMSAGQARVPGPDSCQVVSMVTGPGVAGQPGGDPRPGGWLHRPGPVTDAGAQVGPVDRGGGGQHGRLDHGVAARALRAPVEVLLPVAAHVLAGPLPPLHRPHLGLAGRAPRGRAQPPVPVRVPAQRVSQYARYSRSRALRRGQV